MLDAGFRATGDFRAEKLGAKIRDAQLELIPYMFVVGPRDAEGGTVSVRDRIDGDQGALTIDAKQSKSCSDEIDARTVRKSFSAPPDWPSAERPMSIGVGSGASTTRRRAMFGPLF